MSFTKQTISHWLLASLIFLIPTNLFLNLTDQLAYVNGLRVDYLIIKLYLSELVVWALILTQLSQIKKPWLTKWGWAAAGMMLTLAMAQHWSSNPIVSGWQVLKLLQAGLLVWVLVRQANFFPTKLGRWSLMVAIIFQTSLGLYQFIFQRSLVGFRLLGETNLQTYAGLAKSTLGQIERVLPYGTTAHPNILGGVLAIYVTILVWQNQRNWLTLGVALWGMAGLVLTQSVSAAAMLAVGLVLAWQPARVIRFIHAHQGQALVTVIALHLSVVVLLPAFPLNQNLSLSRRVTLNQAAIAMIDQRPQGVGLQAFTTQLERVSQSREIVRFVQPVHHLGLLWLAETGLLGLVALGVGLIYLKRAQPTWLTGVILAAIWLLPVASLDHYLLTIQTGLLLSALVVSYSIFQAKNEQL